MKKHILGFALFSLIVGLAGFVSAMFYKPVKKEYVYEVTTRSCWKSLRNDSPTNFSKVKIIQAVFDAKSNVLNIGLSIQKEAGAAYSTDATIAVITKTDNKNSNGVVHKVTLNPDYYKDGQGMQTVSIKLPVSMPLRGSANTNENLYVSVKLGSSNDFNEKSVSNDQLEFVPVLFRAKN